MAVAHSSGAAAQPEALPQAPLFAMGWVRGEHPGLLLGWVRGENPAEEDLGLGGGGQGGWTHLHTHPPCPKLGSLNQLPFILSPCPGLPLKALNHFSYLLAEKAVDKDSGVPSACREDAGQRRQHGTG